MQRKLKLLFIIASVAALVDPTPPVASAAAPPSLRPGGQRVSTFVFNAQTLGRSKDTTDQPLHSISWGHQGLIGALEWAGRQKAGGAAPAIGATKPRHPFHFPWPQSKKNKNASTAPRLSVRERVPGSSSVPGGDGGAMGGLSVMDQAISFAAAPVLGPPGGV